MVVFDTYAWIKYFIGSEKGQKVRDILAMEGGKTPSIVLEGMARKYLREGFEESEIREIGVRLFEELFPAIVHTTSS